MKTEEKRDGRGEEVRDNGAPFMAAGHYRFHVIAMYT
jgi:hypothetical protein